MTTAESCATRPGARGGGGAVADPGGPRGPCPPGLVNISHKKDGRQRRLHRFFVSWPPYPAAGSATGGLLKRVGWGIKTKAKQVYI